MLHTVLHITVQPLAYHHSIIQLIKTVAVHCAGQFIIAVTIYQILQLQVIQQEDVCDDKIAKKKGVHRVMKEDLLIMVQCVLVFQDPSLLSSYSILISHSLDSSDWSSRSLSFHLLPNHYTHEALSNHKEISLVTILTQRINISFQL